MRFEQRQFFNEGREENYFARLFGKARRFHRHGSSLDTQAELIQEVSQRYWDHIQGRSTVPVADQSMARRKQTFWSHYCKVRVGVQGGEDIGGFIVLHGELKALWCDIPGLGAGMIHEAIRLGARELSCFDGPLVGLYSQFGFREDRRERNHVDGEPDVVWMELP